MRIQHRERWLPAVLCFLMFSCNKPLPDYSGQPFDYIVTGFADTTVARNDYIIIRPQVTLLTGDASANPISFSLKGLPANVYTDKNNYSFRLAHDLTDSIGAHQAIQGVYPLQAVFTSPAGTKTYNFNLTVGPPVDRIINVRGYYYPSNTCWQELYVSCQIDSIPGAPGQVMFIDRKSPNEMTYGTFDTTYGSLDCCTNTVTIPWQLVKGVTVYGTFAGNAGPGSGGTLTRTFITDTNTYTCSVSL